MTLRKVILPLLILLVTFSPKTGSADTYHPELQAETGFQYFRPAEQRLGIDDCFPLYSNGVLYLYWSFKPLGTDIPSEWTLSTTEDLIHWKHFPPLKNFHKINESLSGTPSFIDYDGKVHAFYELRKSIGNHYSTKGVFSLEWFTTKPTANSKASRQVHLTSGDGIHFEKQAVMTFPDTSLPHAYFFPQAFSLIQGKPGVFHFFYSGIQSERNTYRRNACILHYVSSDLKTWEYNREILFSTPRHPSAVSYFEWNGFYYLLYNFGDKTFYAKSKSALGPWKKADIHSLSQGTVRDFRHASFNKRHLIVGMFPEEKEMKQPVHSLRNLSGNPGPNPPEYLRDRTTRYATRQIIFRELIQFEDGSLGIKTPPELLPQRMKAVKPEFIPLTSHAQGDFSALLLDAGDNSAETIVLKPLPENFRLRMRVVPVSTDGTMTIRLTADDNPESGFPLEIHFREKRITLGNAGIDRLDMFGDAFMLDIIVDGNIVDVSVDNKRCLINRNFDRKGNRLYFSARNGKTAFLDIKAFSIKKD